MCATGAENAFLVLYYAHTSHSCNALSTVAAKYGDHQTEWRRLITSPLAQWSWPCVFLIANHNNEMGNTKWPWGLLHDPFWEPSCVTLTTPLFSHTDFSLGSALSWAIMRDERVVRGSQSAANNSGAIMVPIVVCLAASSAKLLPVAIRESVFWCAGHFMIATAAGRCIASSSAETAFPYVTGVPSAQRKPLCFHILPCTWHTPYAYAKSV